MPAFSSVFETLFICTFRYLHFRLRILFYGFNGVKTGTLEPQFQFQGQQEITGGQIWWIWWLIDAICYVFGLKFGHNCPSMQWPFPTDFLTQSLQYDQIVFFIDCLFLWNGFMMRLWHGFSVSAPFLSSILNILLTCSHAWPRLESQRSRKRLFFHRKIFKFFYIN